MVEGAQTVNVLPAGPAACEGRRGTALGASGGLPPRHPVAARLNTGSLDEVFGYRCHGRAAYPLMTKGHLCEIAWENGQVLDANLTDDGAQDR